MLAPVRRAQLSRHSVLKPQVVECLHDFVPFLSLLFGEGGAVDAAGLIPVPSA